MGWWDACRVSLVHAERTPSEQTEDLRRDVVINLFLFEYKPYGRPQEAVFVSY